MSLKGTLKDFSVGDIFQLIGQQTKSGSLYVRSNEKEAHIVFDQGKVVLGTFRKSDEDFLLGTMLLRAGAITAEQLSAAVENQRITLRSLGDILRSMGAITAEVLGEFVQLQLQEVLFRIFQWKEGLYEFVAEQIRYNKTVIKPQAAEAVLMDGFRMLDEWPRVIQKIGSLEVIFRPLVDAGQWISDGGPVASPEVKVSNFSETEKKILRLLDGSRALQEVIYLSRLGTFETCRILADLLDRGQVIKLDQLGQTRIDRRHPASPSKNLKDWLAATYPVLFVLLVLATGLPWIATRIPSDRSLRKAFRLKASQTMEVPITVRRLLNYNQRERLEYAIELYRLQNDAYPRSLEFFGTQEISSNWVYEGGGSGYRLGPFLTPP